MGWGGRWPGGRWPLQSPPGSWNGHAAMCTSSSVLGPLQLYASIPDTFPSWLCGSLLPQREEEIRLRDLPPQDHIRRWFPMILCAGHMLGHYQGASLLGTFCLELQLWSSAFAESQAARGQWVARLGWGGSSVKEASEVGKPQSHGHTDRRSTFICPVVECARDPAWRFP